MKKTAFFLRIILVLSVFSLLCFFRYQQTISLEIYILSTLCVFFSCFFGPALFLTVNLPFLIIAVVDWHLIRMYRLSVTDAAAWVSMLILDTNRFEVYEYLSKINIAEYALLFPAFLSVFFVWFHRPARKAQTLFYVAFWLAFPLSYISHIYPAARFLLIPEEKSVLNEHNAFKFAPSSSPEAAQNVIVIIGESHRYGEFQESFQKYEQKFTPLYNFSDFISNHANTMNAVPIILSRKKFKDKPAYFHEKSVFSLFEEAGYETYFLHYTDSSNFTEKNKLSFVYNDAMHFVNFAAPKGSLHDIRIYRELDKILNGSKQKKFIVIKMLGVHIDFKYRYPAAYDFRKPSLKDMESKSTFLKTINATFFPSSAYMSPANKEIILNTYKNAMDYSAEIIQSLFVLAQKQQESTLIMFSSDHGICIFDKDAFQIPPDCKEAFHIPVLFYLNPALDQTIRPEKLKNLSCNTDKPLTQEYLFETIASLAGISYPTANEEYDLTKKCFSASVKRNIDQLGVQSLYEDL